MKQLKKLSLTLALLITAAAGAWAQGTTPEVTISQDAETKQYEASFKMPQYDVTATYTIKRDMSVDMAVTVQDANEKSSFRVQKDGSNYVPYGQSKEQMKALFKVHDDIESKDLTVTTDYIIQIFAADKDGNATGEAMTFDNFTYAPANTPLLVKNNAAETKTILLNPTTTDTPDNVTAYSGFKGTAEETTIAASTDSRYSLDGRRLAGKPGQKGVYIVNGRKVVVK